MQLSDLISRRPLAELFWRHVDKTEREHGCWLWTAACTEEGAGRFNVNINGDRRPVDAHRIAWLLTHGNVPDDMFVVHACGKDYAAGETAFRACVRPDHLFLGTARDSSYRTVFRRSRRPKPCIVCGKTMLVHPYCWDRKRYCSKECMGVDAAKRLNRERKPHAATVPVQPLMGIYAITNQITGAQYVGSSNNLMLRWSAHRQALARGKHHNALLQAAWSEQGAEAFRFSVLEQVDDPNGLARAEQRWRAALHPLYNGRALAAHQWGTTLDDLAPYGDWQQRFWAKVDTSGDCWLWTAQLFPDGYGALTFTRLGLPAHVARAHRLAYVLEYGAIPQGMEVCHTCDHPACVRPSHLFIGSRLQNMHDMMAKGRMSPHWSKATMRGSNSPRTHLRETDIPAIRARYASGERLKAIGRDFGIGVSTVHDIGRRRTWRHVD